MAKEEKTEAEKKRARAPRAPKAKEEETKEAPKAEAPKAEEKAEGPKTEAKAEAPKAEKPASEAKRKRKAAPKKPSKKVFVARGKRKESIARATIQEGKGGLRLNNQSVYSISNPYIREIIREPLRYVGPESNNVDISVSVNGGGVMGQAQAARTAIANALVMYFEGMNLKQKFIEVDRTMVVEDTRRVEPKKYRGPKARARFQKSYR